MPNPNPHGAQVHYAFGKLKTSEVPFEYGFSYRAIFFSLTEDLRLDRFSRELLLPALDSARAPHSAAGAVQHFAEGIQFITSAVVEPEVGVTLVYGVNDCEAAKMRLSFARLDQMLEFAHRPNHGAQDRSRPAAAQAWHRSTARGLLPEPGAPRTDQWSAGMVAT